MNSSPAQRRGYSVEGPQLPWGLEVEMLRRQDQAPSRGQQSGVGEVR